MFEPTKCLSPPEKFPFPFEAYQIQNDFMKELYQALENKNIGVFESPTGTGKSLSLICGSFCWLKDNEKRYRDELEKEIQKVTVSNGQDESDLNWFTSQSQNNLQNRRKVVLEAALKKLQLKDERIEEMKKRCTKLHSSAVEKADREFRELFGNGKGTLEDLNADVSENLNEESDLILEDYESDQDDEESIEAETEHVEPEDVKIIYCSRTHSQLSQFVGEVRSSPYADSIRLVSLASRQSLCINPAVNKLRSQALINERCLDLQKGRKGKPTKTTEKSDGSSGQVLKRSRNSKGCPFLCPGPLKRLTEEVIVGDGGIADVEDLVKKGKRIGACPYYAARASVKDAQVIVVPYNTLLHRSTREACGIRLEGNVVIVDEAHNLLDTIEHIHSAEVAGNQLTHAYSQLKQYHGRYNTRFSAKNLLHLNQLIFVLGKLIRILGGIPGCNPMEISKGGSSPTKLLSIPEFVSNAEIDCMNLYVLQKFITKSKITRKLQGFSEIYSTENEKLKMDGPTAGSKAIGIKAFLKEISTKAKEETNNSTEETRVKENSQLDERCGNSPLLPVISFLEGLVNRADDGRVAVTRATTVGRGTLKFLLLNPAAQFSDIVCLPRSLILAGGTMQPISEFQEQLALSVADHVQSYPLRKHSRLVRKSSSENLKEDKNLSSNSDLNGDSVGKQLTDQLSVFSCGHVVPAENILPLVILTGPSGRTLNFSYNERTLPETINELGRVLLNLCNIIPGGVIVFFPSYDYEKCVYNHFDKRGTLTKLEAKKKVFREPRKSSDVDKILENYAACIKNSKSVGSSLNGAILLSVVGGKMSEGINFSNDLGRCVIMVGMPYANIQSAELKEKMSFLDSHSSTPSAGQRYYESLCMKAVNQSIGRCIRHSGDYAAMILLDTRYGKSQTISALPSWIQTSTVIQSSFGGAVTCVRKFQTLPLMWAALSQIGSWQALSYDFFNVK